VFWVNLPIGAIALVAGFFFVPETKDPTAPRLDPLGALLSIVGLGSVLFAIIEGPSKGWTSDRGARRCPIGMVGCSRSSRGSCTPTTRCSTCSFFENPRFTAANIAVTLTFFAMFGSLFLMTQYWQLVHGFTPLEAGVHLIPYALTMMFTAPLSARLVEQLGTKRVVTIGLALISAAMLVLSTHPARLELPPRDRQHVRHGGGHGAHDGAGHRERDGVAAPREGRGRFGRERHDPPDGRRARRGRDRQPRRERVRRRHRRRGRSSASPARCSRPLGGRSAGH
jgi:hypothetical protein